MALSALIFAFVLLSSTAPHGVASFDSMMPDFPEEPSLPAPMKGEINCQTIDDKRTCTATCITGYRFDSPDAKEGDELVNEWTDGSWTLGSKFPKCIKVVCEAAAPVNGKVVCEPNGDFTLCSVECDAGFRTSHTHLYMCDLKTGDWSPSLPETDSFGQCLSGEVNCLNMDAPENGYVLCDHIDGEHRCTPSCKRGFALTSVPQVGYFSCQDGTWFPNELAVCSPTSDPVDPIGMAAVTGVYTNGDVPVEQTGYCMTWGQHHYRTFDGKIYRFQGECSYTLIEDKQHFFTVILHNSKDCTTTKCARSLTIYVGDLEIELKGDARDGVPGAFVDDVSLPLPASLSGVLVQRVADFIVVRDPETDFYVKWDGLESIFIRVGEDNIGQTQGLCGMYDRDYRNDFTKSDGKISTHVTDFAESWAVGTCGTSETKTYCSKVTDADQQTLATALRSCEFLMDTKCKYVVNPAPYFEACKEDVCWTGNDDSVCSSMSAYFRECSRLGVIVDWRNKDRCEISCPGKLCYDVCGTSCPKTCFDTSYNCENDHCIEGCHCPEGTYLHNGTCVTQYQCPCQYGQQEYAPGSKIRQDCNRCVCARGRWVCTKNVCDSVCKVVGNHFTTFDGKDFDYSGKCNYVLAKSEGVQDIAFEITLINTCTGSRCDKSLKVTVNSEEIIIFHDGKVEIENKEVMLPHHTYFFAMEKVTTNFYKVTINNGITILFDGESRVYVRSKPTLSGRMRGMCGNFNQQTKDDFHTPMGDIAANANDFGDEWVTGDCSFPDTPNEFSAPCDVKRTYKTRARESCEVITSSVFSRCHDLVNYKLYFTNCMDDICTHEDVQLQCRALGDYAMACAKLGVVLGNWREKVTECATEVECPTGTQFKECANACGSSCGSLQTSTICDEQCVPGCTCPEGHVFDYDGNCVEVSQCSCMFENVIYEAGESRMQDCNVCECHHGKWACTDNICPISSKCLDNEEFTSCMKPEIVTCSNMHLPQINRKIERCMAGCQCKDGYVWDIASSMCVTPKTCPCYHGGRSYSESETMQQDCNTCRCLAGVWDCEANECAGMCRAYGDSHYTTFDGKDYQFHGVNTFTLVRSTDESEHKFQVSIENVGCGSRGGTCSKRVVFSINLGDKTKENSIDLVKGKTVQEKKIGSFEVTYVGLWVFVKAKDMGVMLQWDRGTTVMVRVDPEYKGKVEGLCGDFNDNENDDFKNPQNIIEVSEVAFVNTWKTYLNGSSAEEVPSDICGLNSHRKYWAERKCAILTGDTFEACHALVDPRSYYTACVFDACACDSGGDCECLCTALHAYAQECNRHGVHIYWRSQSLCPLMCYGKEREYNPCMSACPKTCDNYNNYDKIKSNCEYSCVEGCDCCGDGMVASKDGEICLPAESCVCKEIDGISYSDGEKIECMSDQCRSCYCMDHDIHCLGLPCEDGGVIPPISTCIGEYGASAEYGGFQFKPAELTPALCGDLYDNLINTCGKENMITCSFRCNQVCHAWKTATSQCTFASSEDQCVDTCGEECVSCPLNYVLKDPLTCVRPSDCLCMLPDGSTLGPGQVKNDQSACIRYYCWNNELTDELIIGCKPSVADAYAEAITSADRAGLYMDGGMMLPDLSGVGVASKVGTGSDGSKILIVPGHKGPSDRPTGHITTSGSPTADVTGDASSDFDTKIVDSGHKYSTEPNGVIIKHLSSSAADALADATSTFNGMVGYTDMEWNAIKRDGPVAVSADGTASIFHDAPTVASSSTGGDVITDGPGGKDGFGGDATSMVGADASGPFSVDGFVDGKPGVPVDEKPICIDESGTERCYGDQWVYASSACKTCSCVAAGSIECQEKQCDPYPECPSGHFVVEEKLDGCCTSYRIVKESCDVSECAQTNKTCGLNEIMISYAIDDCCAAYECHCDVSSCFKLGTAPCPSGHVRAVVDQTQCCSVGKCVPESSVTADAYASADSGLTLLGLGFGSGDDSGFPGSISTSGSPYASGEGSATGGFGDHLSIVPQIAEEACLCIDSVGKEHKFGEQWYETTDGCQLCTCTDKDNVVCSTEQCEEPLPEKEGMTIVEDKTSKCCSTYRYVPEDCDISACQYEAVQCSGCQRATSYKIDDCCTTHECVCDESRCVNYGNPPCPPGSVRVVVDQDVCCPVPKCVYMDGPEATSAANAAAKMASIHVIGGSGDGSGMPWGGYPHDQADFADKPVSDDSMIPTGDSGKQWGDQPSGETMVTTYVPGKTNLGSTAMADLTGDAPFGFGAFGPQFGGFPFPSSASATGKGAADSGPTKYLLLGSPKSQSGSGPYGSASHAGDASASAAADAGHPGLGQSGAPFGSDFEIAVEAAICVDKSGAEHHYGAQWSDACMYCTCVGTQNIVCKSETCDPEPTVGEGEKLVTETSSGCCNTYRVVSDDCDVSACQYTPPTCQACEKLVTFSLDKCCATYECRCNKEMCSKMDDAPCPTGFTRMVISPEACCPVGKCVSSSDKIPGSDIGGSGSAIYIPSQGQSSGYPHMSAHTTGSADAGFDASASAPSSTTMHFTGGKNAVCDEPMCMDEHGRSRCYGETWYKNGDACHMCACTNANTISCEPRTCEPYPSVPEGHKVVEEKADDCCYSYKIVPDECDMSNCTQTAPVCAACEDLVRYSIDKCCSTYECTCNPSKCFQLANAPCPSGMERIVADSNDCCAIGKCVATSSPVYGPQDDFYGNGHFIPGGYSPADGGLVGTFTTGGAADAYVSADATGGDSSFEIISEAVICEDASGQGRCYGDTWQEGCNVCTCSNVDKITCMEKECPEIPEVGTDEKLIKESSDGCCEYYRSVPSTCNVTECDETMPTCSYCQDVVQYKTDDCCATFECQCNPNKCLQLDVVSCPLGSERIVVDGDLCCPVGKCVKTQDGGKPGSFGADAYADSHLPFIDGGMLSEELFKPDSIKMTSVSTGMPSVSLDAAAGDGGFGSFLNFDVYPEDKACMDDGGVERAFGETWVEKSSVCKVCICHSAGSIRCSLEKCQEYPESKPGYKIIEEKSTECCYSYRMIPEECDLTKCQYEAPVCEYCQDLVTYPIDECCSTYECQCNKDKCLETNEEECPAGYHRVTIEQDKCCSVPKCVRDTENDSTNVKSEAQSSTGLNALQIYGQQYGGMPISAQMSSSGMPQASGVADASSPFDTHMDFAHHDSGKGDFGPAYYADGDHVSADASADAQGTGFGDGMYFGQPTPMYWPGADSKVAADAGSKATSDGPHIIYDAVPGFDGSYPEGVVTSSGMPQASVAADASSPFDTHMDFAHHDSGKGDFGPAYYADGDHVSADASADAQGTGFGDGMYFGQPTPMYWPGTDSKVAADAGSKVTPSGPHIVFDAVPGFDGSYPDAVLSSTGKPQASGVADASSPFGSEMSLFDGVTSEMPSCIDECGNSRNFGENWYRKDDPCDICTCQSYGEVKCEIKSCEDYPIAPTGYKVHSVRSDDCCFTYTHVPEDCDMETCSSTVPVCQFYEDLQVYPEDKCCSTYECSCNPNKCSTFGNFVCPEGQVPTVIDSTSCCSVPKCKYSTSASATAFADAGFNSLIHFKYMDDSVMRPSAPKDYMDDMTPVDEPYVPTPSVTTLSQGSPGYSGVPGITIIPGATDQPSYASYVSDRHNYLLDSYFDKLSDNSTSVCDFVTDSSACPSSCPTGLVCDGLACVSPKDCPCYSNFIRRQTGAVWKEDNGCTDCICIGGKAECVPMTCDVISCPSGEKLVKSDTECCGSCVPDQDGCEDASGNKYSLWQTWKGDCETCTCTLEDGVVCEAEQCDDSNKPTCASDEMLITRKSGCCNVYECMCDTLQCGDMKAPTCEQYHSAVITNPGECCPSYDCICRPEKCPAAPKCGANEMLERTNPDTECCGEYQCKPIGCTDETGTFRDVETTWQMANDTCQQCSCLSDLTVMCKSRECSQMSKPVCEDGNEPTVIFDVDGCCPKYVCNFVCRGYAGSSRIQTFDGESFAKFCTCTHVLAKDTFGLDFEISVERAACNGGICTNVITIADKLTGQEYQIHKDTAVNQPGLSAFEISEVDNKVTVLLKSTGVKVVFDHAFDTWSIHVPATFAGKTEGLCGMADGDCDNDFWAGGYPTGLDQFFDYWLLTPGCSEVSVSAEASTSYCTDVFSKGAFAEMASVVDTSEYIDTCGGIIPPNGQPDWPGCSIFAAFASAAARAGKCVDWRSDDFCSYGTCSVAGAVYSACGPSVVKTCDNYKTYAAVSTSYGVEGCFCTGDDVLYKGMCVPTSSCPVCTDENGVGRANGEQWYYKGDTCMSSICLADGTITHNTVVCSEAPTCGSDETLAKVSDDACCPTYVCVPNGDDCSDVVCPTVVKPTCAFGEEWKVSVTGEKNCCLNYTCECKPESCPQHPVPVCEEGEELEVVDADKCCPTATCVCKADSCPAAPTCDQEGHSLKVVKEGRCCSTYECVCDRCTCPTSTFPTCANGEVPVVKDPTACCPSYDCVCDKTRCPPTYNKMCASGYKRIVTSQESDCCETYECQCDVTQCPTVQNVTCPDKPGYKVISTGIEKSQPGLPDCCPVSYQEICVCDVEACPVDEVTCESWERKYQTNAGECCPTYACECDYATCDKGPLSCPMKQRMVETKVNECCTTRTCECDECVDPTPCEEGWKQINLNIDMCGCKTFECEPPSMCLIDGVEHQPGATWMEDICTECTCDTMSAFGKGSYAPKCTPIKCGTCSAGYTYVPVAGQCCGDCVPTVCHYNGKQYAPGQTWTSPDNKCTTCECMIDPINNEVYSQCNAPTCPPVDDTCDPDDLITTVDGCCTYCAPKTTPQTCRPVADFVEEFELDGCKSQGKVNVTMCEGQCTSASVFSIDTGKFEKQCSCCSAQTTEDRTIDLQCPDGSTKEYTYKVATSCACGATTCGVGLP